MSKSNILVWFRNDLRLQDNEALFKALKLATKRTKVVSKIVPMFLFDTNMTQRSAQYAVAKLPFQSGYRRTMFLQESVENLARKIPMVVRCVDMGDKTQLQNVFVDVIQKYNITDVFVNREGTDYELKAEKVLEQTCEEKDVSTHFTWSFSLVHIDDLPYDQVPEKIPNIYSAFRKKIEKKGLSKSVRDLLTVDVTELRNNIEQIDEAETELPKLRDLYNHDFSIPTHDKRAVYKFIGGEDEAMKRLEEYSSYIKHYKDERNNNLGANYSSKLSCWLAVGAISPKMIYHHFNKMKTKSTTEKEAIQAFNSELLWRDYFRLLAMKHSNTFFHLMALQPNKKMKYEWEEDKDKFEAWCEGRTGYPFVDACIREMNATGFLHNRGRMVVASFFAKDAHMDWRMGAEYFEQQLIDYDVTSNYGNWAWAAGVGCDFRSRYFNPIKQGIDHDPEGTYIKRWIPELRHISHENFAVHIPFTLSAADKKTITDYPTSTICDVPLPAAVKKMQEKLKKKALLAPAASSKPRSRQTTLKTSVPTKRKIEDVKDVKDDDPEPKRRRRRVVLPWEEE